MYLWKRHATALWLEANECRLEQFAPGAVAIICRPGRAGSRVQIACKTLAQALCLMRRFQGSAEQLPRDWQESFLQRDADRPIRIRKRLLIVASPGGTTARPTQTQLVIPAAGAFGTGDHATTAMSLRFLEETTRRFSPGWRMFDAGCGTGILALAAHCFGARQILGIDRDPSAVAHARENARLNQMDGLKFLTCDLLTWKPRTRYDLIAANLFSEVLIAALPTFRRALRKEAPSSLRESCAKRQSSSLGSCAARVLPSKSSAAVVNGSHSWLDWRTGHDQTQTAPNSPTAA